MGHQTRARSYVLRGHVLRLCLMLALLIGLVVSENPLTASSAPQKAMVDMSVNPGFGGNAVTGGWIPVAVTLRNQGEEISGEIQVRPPDQSDRGAFSRAPTVFTVPVSLPSHSEKRFTVPVYLSPTQNPTQSGLAIALVSGSTIVNQQIAQITLVPDGELLCGVLSRDNAISSFLSRLDLPDRRRPVHAVDLVVSDIPNKSNLLTSLDCMVMGNIPLTSLVDDQRAAIEQWVSTGGLLILAAGDATARVVAALPNQLSPVEIKGMGRVGSMDALKDFTGQEMPGQGDYLVPNATLTNGVTVVEQDQIPIVAAGRRGAGAVIYLGFDPTSEPYRSWGGEDQLWRFIMSQSSAPFAGAGPTLRPTTSWGRVPRTAISSMPPLEAPSVLWPFLMFGGYVLLVGPVNYLVLRRVGKLHWSWVTVPAITIFATGLAFQLAGTYRVRDLAISEVSIVRAQADSPTALRHSYLGVFSSRSMDLDLGFSNALPTSLYFPVPRGSDNESEWLVRARESGSSNQAGFHLKAGSFGTLMVDDSVELAQGFTGDLTFDGDRIVGVITNRTDQHLLSASLVVGRSIQRIGDLPPGASAEIDLPVGEAAGGPDLPTGINAALVTSTPQLSPETRQSREDIVQSVFNPGFTVPPLKLSGASLLGWLENYGPQFTSGNANSAIGQHALATIDMSIKIKPGIETELPSQFVTSRQLLGLGARTSEPGTYDLSTGGLLVLEFELPVKPSEFQVDRLYLHIGAMLAGGPRQTGGELGEVRLFNWQKQDWDAYLVAFGATSFDNPGAYISPLGDVRVLYSFRPPPGTNIQGIKFTQFEISAGGRSQ